VATFSWVCGINSNKYSKLENQANRISLPVTLIGSRITSWTLWKLTYVMLCYVMLCYVNSMRLSPLYVTTSKKQISAIVFAARCISAAYAVMRCVCVSQCLSVCLSRSWVVSKRIKISSKFFFTIGQPHHSSFSIPCGMAIFWREPPPLTGASNAGGVGRNRDSEPICLLLTLQQARCCKHGLSCILCWVVLLRVVA